MVADQLRDYLENGNIANAVNFPNVSMARESRYRVAIANANVPNMLGQISTAMAQAGLNIHNMVNKSRGDMAYTLVDVDSAGRRRRRWPRSRASKVCWRCVTCRRRTERNRNGRGGDRPMAAKWRKSNNSRRLRCPTLSPTPSRPSRPHRARAGSSFRCRSWPSSFPRSTGCPCPCASCWSRCCATATARRSRAEHVRQLANWFPNADRTDEIPFVVARVVLQDFTGVPLLADLAAMRSVAPQAGQARRARSSRWCRWTWWSTTRSWSTTTARKDALDLNMKLEFQRNRERYEFMKWGMQAFEHLRRGAARLRHRAPGEPGVPGARRAQARRRRATTPTTLVGTDSHTTMINGIGVVGWGVGGIEAEAAMLGQPVYFLTPDVVGFELTGRLREGCTATDLVLTVTEILRKHKVVGKFVEFFGEGTRTPGRAGPRHHRQHGARVRRDDGLLPGRRDAPSTTSRAPAAPRTRSRPSRPTSGRRACSACRAPARSTTRRWCSSTWATSRPAWRAPSGRRTASRSARWRAVRSPVQQAGRRERLQPAGRDAADAPPGAALRRGARRQGAGQSAHAAGRAALRDGDGGATSRRCTAAQAMPSAGEAWTTSPSATATC